MGEPMGAIIIMICFRCLLRISEGLNLRWIDIFVPFESVGKAVIYLARTKTGKDQHVPLHCRFLISLLYQLEVSIPTSEWGKKVCNLTYNALRERFLRVMQALGLPIGVWRTHSLRRGGATHELQVTQSPEHVCILGRWRSIQSTRTYLKVGEALLAQLLARLTGNVIAKVSMLQEVWAKYVGY